MIDQIADHSAHDARDYLRSPLGGRADGLSCGDV